MVGLAPGEGSCQRAADLERVAFAPGRRRGSRVLSRALPAARVTVSRVHRRERQKEEEAGRETQESPAGRGLLITRTYRVGHG